jgi:hypothetical protein
MASTMAVTVNDYDQRVTEWLTAHGITFSISKIGEEEGFPSERRTGKAPALYHDVYKAEFRRLNDSGVLVVPKYYQSAAHSASQIKREKCKCHGYTYHKSWCPRGSKPETPSAYSVLSGITKSDPGTFRDFCDDYGYDDDSRSAEQTYFAVQDEWSRVRRFFTAEELDELMEIAQ